MAAKADFPKNRKWRRFGEEYIRNGGNIEAAARAAGVERTAAYRRRRDNPDFLLWLQELTAQAMEAAVTSADARLSHAVQIGEALEPPLLRTQDQLYKRTDKIRNTMETGVGIHNLSGVGEKKDDILERAFELGLLG
jgi:dihydroxyacetone kinase